MIPRLQPGDLVIARSDGKLRSVRMYFGKQFFYTIWSGRPSGSRLIVADYDAPLGEILRGKTNKYWQYEIIRAEP